MTSVRGIFPCFVRRPLPMTWWTSTPVWNAWRYSGCSVDLVVFVSTTVWMCTYPLSCVTIFALLSTTVCTALELLEACPTFRMSSVVLDCSCTMTRSCATVDASTAFRTYTYVDELSGFFRYVSSLKGTSFASSWSFFQPKCLRERKASWLCKSAACTRSLASRRCSATVSCSCRTILLLCTARPE